MPPEPSTPAFDGLIVIRRGRKAPGPCAGYPGEDREHEQHLIQPVWILHRSHRVERYGEIAARWQSIEDGFVCAICMNVFEPTPCCERLVYVGMSADVTRCMNRASRREVGVLHFNSPVARDGTVATTEHNYCGGHSPSAHLARRAKTAVKDAERQARWDQRDAADRAERALLDEAIRWRDDETMTEGFCDDDACEHHECRLARAVVAYEEALG